MKNSGNSIVDSKYNHTVTLELISQGNSSGTVLEGTTSLTGTSPFTFGNLSVLSSGDFVLRATSDNLNKAETASFTVENKVKRSEIVSTSASPTVYEDFNLTVSLIGEDDNEFLGYCIVSLLEHEGMVIKENNLAYSEGNSVAFYLYAEKIGNYSFNATVDEGISDYSSGTVEVDVENANIDLTLDTTVRFMQPSNSDTNFEVKIEIHDKSGNLLENADNVDVNLTVNCSSSVQCITPSLGFITVNNGTGNSPGHRFLSSGTFEIQAYGSQLNNDSLIVSDVTNRVLSSQLTTTSTNLTTYQEFNIQVKLKGEDGQDFTGDATVTLELESGIVIAENDKVSSNGNSVSFTVYANASGEYFFSVQTNLNATDYTSGNLTVSIASANIKISLDPTVSFT